MYYNLTAEHFLYYGDLSNMVKMPMGGYNILYFKLRILSEKLYNTVTMKSRINNCSFMGIFIDYNIGIIRKLPRYNCFNSHCNLRYYVFLCFRFYLLHIIVSIIIVTGPSLHNDTFISPPNFPPYTSLTPLAFNLSINSS